MRSLLSVLAAIALISAAAARPAAAQQSYPTVRLGSGDQPMGNTAFAGTTTGLPGWLRWALAPQFQDGTTLLGVIGLPERSYRGVAWTMPVANGLLQRDDRVTIGFSLGNGLGESLGDDGGFDPRALRPTPTSRLGAAIGYQLTNNIGVYVMFDHISVSGIAREDEISNDLGMRLGLRF